MKTINAAAALAAFLLPVAVHAKDCGPLPPVFEGVAFVGDGDTIYGVGFKAGIRIWGMNAPELRTRDKAETVPGMRARALVADLLADAGHQVRVDPIEWVVYCRVVATVRTARGVDLTLAAIEAGMAYGFYLARHPARVETALAYSDAEAVARKEHRGLWPIWLGE